MLIYCSSISILFYLLCFFYKEVWLWFCLQASYCDGKLKTPPKPCAGNQGTLISVGLTVISNFFATIAFFLKIYLWRFALFRYVMMDKERSMIQIWDRHKSIINRFLFQVEDPVL